MAKRQRRNSDNSITGDLIPADGTPYCAYVRDDGTQCLNRPQANDTKCHIHSRKRHYKGVSDPHFKAPKLTDPNDRFVRNLPESMKQDYLEALVDPHLCSSQREIAALETRLAQLFSRAANATGESKTRWEGLRELAMELDSLEAEAAELTRKGDVDEAKRIKAEHLRKYSLLKRAILEGATSEDAWSEFEDATERYAKLKESQTNRMSVMHQMMTLDQYGQFVASYMAAVRRHVKDPAVIKKIADEIEHPGDLTG